MHGLIFVQLQKFAIQSIGADEWRRALKSAGLDGQSFSAAGIYDDSQAFELIGLAARTLNVPIGDVIELFGRFISTELIRLYQRVIKPSWKTLEIIENTETFVHSAVRAGNPGASPPVLDAIRISETELQLLYSSDRKLCKLAIGIIKGLAAHFDEVIEIQKDTCMHNGDPYCSFRLIRSSVKLDTEKISLGNTVHFDSKGHITSTVSHESSDDLSPDSPKAATASEPIRWDQFVSPPLFEADFGTIGPYRLLARQGEGGMGCVFRSIDTRTEQLVAVKILHPKFAKDSTSQKRFMRELSALQKISSPHVVSVRDVGQIGQLPYLVMEFLKGTNLNGYCARFQSLPIHEVLRIAIETVLGLSAVHDCGIIHRDLKPDNIWVESPSLNLKIIDFGIAHAMSEEMRLTRTGTFIGTPSFMSPEQAGGGAIDHRADFFGFGCILYELTTGKRPFDRANIISTLSAIATHTPERPIDLQPELPQDLSDLIMDLLEKSPSKRPGDCQEILSRVRAIARDLN